MTHVRERHQVIRDEIVAGLLRNGMTIRQFAKRIGKSQTSVGFCIRGVTSPKPIRAEIVKLLGFDPWEKHPPVAYRPLIETDSE